LLATASVACEDWELTKSM